MNLEEQKNIINHYKENWILEDPYFITLEKGPMKEHYPEFTILVNPPTKNRDMCSKCQEAFTDEGIIDKVSTPKK